MLEEKICMFKIDIAGLRKTDSMLFFSLWNNSGFDVCLQCGLEQFGKNII